MAKYLGLLSDSLLHLGVNEIKAILVDDEASARNILGNLLARFCPSVSLLASCKNVEEAVDAIRTLKPDLVFLDIEMPNYAGYEIVEFFDEVDFQIIFVTAYDKYALRAFEVSAVDYLLKPIEIDRLKQAVERASDRIDKVWQKERMNQLKDSLKSGEAQNLVVAEKGMQHVVNFSEIIAIEAHDAYSTIHLTGRKIVVSKNLGHFETTLEGFRQFVRTHKSWIVNLDHLVSYAKTAGEIHLATGLIAKLSKYKKAEFEAKI